MSASVAAAGPTPDTINSLIADWRADILWDIVYARVQTNWFLYAHASSFLFLCFTVYYFWLVKKEWVAVAAFAVFGSAAIHEFTLDIVDIFLFKIDSGLSLAYGVYLAAFLVIGWFIVSPYHKKIWLLTVVVMFMFYFVAGLWLHLGSTLNGYGQPDPTFFYSPVSNAGEVLSWVIPTALWFLPRRWFSRRSEEIPLHELFPR